MFKSEISPFAVELLWTFLIVVLLTWYLYYLYCFTYWKKRGVPTHRPHFPAGNITKAVTGRENLFVTVENFYKEFKSRGHRHGGLYFFNGPVYLPIDPEIVKSILTTDFEHFMDRGVFFDEEKFPLSAHIFSITGSKWRNLRAKLSPTFSSGKLKAITIEPIAQRNGEVNIKYVATNFTSDIISSTALGLETNTLKNPDNNIAQITFRMFNPSSWLFLKAILLQGFCNPGNLLRVTMSDKGVENFFVNLVTKMIKLREETKIVRKDFLSLILEIRDNEGLSFNEIVAQCFVFFLAGFETSSQTIKTLRLHPVLGFLNRICVKPYKVPGTDVTIEEGTPVLISTLGLQLDPDYYPDPLEFDPDRFSKNHSNVPFTFLPFGDGPRFCIGMRYGKLQTKLGIASLISQFKFSPSPKTPKYVELDRFSKSLAMTPSAGVTVRNYCAHFSRFFLLSWYLYHLYCFTYWKKRGVPTQRPHFPAGNITKAVTGRENLFVTVENFYKEFKSRGHRHGGLYFFNGPVYLPIDPEIVKSILTTDFEHFVDRGVFFDEENFPLSAHIFSITGNKWKNLRAKLSPTFSSGKLKAMYETFTKTAAEFVHAIEPFAQQNGEVNIKNVANNFTADIISSTALGLETNTLKNPDNKVSQIMLNMLNPSNWLFLKAILLEGFRNPGNLVRVIVSNKNVENFFVNLVKDTINLREETKLARKDFLSLILEIKDKEELSFNEIVAQCFLFFLAGFETSSQAISFCIHELAHHQHIQDKLREEIFEKMGKDYTKYSYEDVLKLPYLDQVFNETLRLHPALGFLNRICVKPYKVPGTDVTIEEGTPVLIPTLGLQLDPDYYPEPLEFDPDRFSENHSNVPFTFLPFGEGPRFCIGMRYGKLQTKLGIASLISQFKFTPSPKTPKYVEADKLSKTLAMIPKLLCTFFTILLLSWYLYFLNCFTYWKKRGVPTHHPRFPAGNLTKPMTGRENLFITIENLYREFKSKGHRHGGLYFFNGPIYLPVDPEIVKSILATDFEHFMDRGAFYDEKNFPLSAHLFSMTGDKWKNLRAKLSPAFSPGKVKAVYEIFIKTTENLIKTIGPIAERRDYITNIQPFGLDVDESIVIGRSAQSREFDKSDKTWRLHPIVGFLNRICVKPYKVPGTDVTIEEGIPVLISTLGLHLDPDYYPDPLEFDPERFSEIQSHVPFTFLPFGEGPRFCIVQILAQSENSKICPTRPNLQNTSDDSKSWNNCQNFQICFNYWKKKGLPTLKPRFPVGDLALAAWGKESVFTRLETLYNEFKAQGHKHGGIYFFNGPIYFPVHPDMVKRVLVTDFDHFVDRGMYENAEKLPLSSHIFSMKGDQWKNIRVKMSPTFTSGKMKSMYNIVLKHCEHLVKTVETLSGGEVDMKDILRRFTCDIVGSTSFGIDCNSLKYPDTEFVRMVEKIFSHSSWKLLKVALEEGLQNPGNIIKISHSDKTVEEYFTNLVRETIDYRDRNNVVRDDFLNILIQLRNTEGMSFKEIVAQSFLFFTAGFETSSLTMSYCIHELAHNEELQDKVREEIHEQLGRDSSKYSYEDILTLPCLDKIVKETLRKYPPAAMLNRICVKEYLIPGTSVIIEEGTPVIISLLGLQRDPDYYPDPLKFDPERFSSSNKTTPYTYLPFGDGPRNCIGLRFGYMQTKLGLASLLNDFKFFPSPKSPRHLVIDPSTTTIALNVLNGVHTRIIKI
ncbi:p450 domain containing protein [Asbolus verrucosus]|uniref:p450 domain containing protein n=1 Tax=Asbolus verrucosus TaxID=1661398 RepID=A0A482VJE7_ASBVE|nr:p450 domain containing protein [Asbolus verrucosus]